MKAKHTKEHPWKRIKQPMAFRAWRNRNKESYQRLRVRFFVENGERSAV